VPERKYWIVVAEDNPADVFLVQTALEQASVECELTVLPEGEAAMEFLAGLNAEGAACPDLILLDLNLPRYTGEEILTRLRASPICGSIPVVVLTSSDSPADREHMSRLGASFYFQKPNTLDSFLELGELVRAVLEGRTPVLAPVVQ
jgi:two-component system, chemotaxis family, response regulator Rcp1